MQISHNARYVLAAFGSAQGIDGLAFDEHGQLPIALDALQLVLTYRPSQDCFVLFSIVDPDPAADEASLWSQFEVNAELAGRASRLALDPVTGALVLIAEIACEGLAAADFEQAFESFVADMTRLDVTQTPSRPRAPDALAPGSGETFLKA